MSKRILITGLNGFIGHHVAEHFLKNSDCEIVGLDRIDATSTLHRLRWIENWKEVSGRVKFVWHDLRAPINASVSKELGPIDVALHLAASTHVDRSITDPLDFVYDNVIGTAHMLEWARSREKPLDLFINFSTDEVFGPAGEEQQYREWDRFNSGNPYAATKAGAEQIACAYANTYGLRILTTFTMNVFGERQHPEKFIPNTISKVSRGEIVVIHSNKDRTKSGSRFYLHASNVGRALEHLVESRPRERYDRYNIVGEREVSNLEMAQMIADILGKPLKYELVDFHSSRPGHDLRYALDGKKLSDEGFSHALSLEKSLEKTVQWYLTHEEWL